MASDAFEKPLLLFGGQLPWKEADWTSSDDRVRGGRSVSHLGVLSNNEARFYGHLDIKTLGGAGFASQRTTGKDRTWNLEGYDGIILKIVKNAETDDKKYTFNIKTQLLPPDPHTGREQSTISYEFDFDIENDIDTRNRVVPLFIPWSRFRATYRGREDKNAPKIDLKNIKRFGIMIRSFFGGQDGDFTLLLKSITAVKVKHCVLPQHDRDLGRIHTKIWKSETGEVSNPDPTKPKKSSPAAFALKRITEWATEKANALYPDFTFSPPADVYMSDDCRKQVANLFNTQQSEFWQSLAVEKLVEAAPLLEEQWEYRGEAGQELAGFLMSIADVVPKESTEYGTRQSHQLHETHEGFRMARFADNSKHKSLHDHDLEKQEEALTGGDVSSGDKKTPDGETPPAARAAPSTYKVLYVVGALLLALWVLHPGNCK